MYAIMKGFSSVPKFVSGNGVSVGGIGVGVSNTKVVVGSKLLNEVHAETINENKMKNTKIFILKNGNIIS